MKHKRLMVPVAVDQTLGQRAHTCFGYYYCFVSGLFM